MKKRLMMFGITVLILMSAVCGFAQGNSAASQIETISAGSGTVVLNDVTFTIAPDARFFAQDEKTAVGLSSFKEGDWVEFSINSNGEIDEMWLSTENR